MHFRLTYAGRLLASRNDKTQSKRSLHKHNIRKAFHKQLKYLWKEHPVLAHRHASAPVIGSTSMNHEIESLGFNWKPIVTEDNGLICALDILLLRHGAPGRTIHDIENRLKTVFDALCIPSSLQALGSGLTEGPSTPDTDESPFFVLLEDDRLITHLSVTSDILLEPVEGIEADQSARLVISVTVRPYNVTMDNLDFS